MVPRGGCRRSLLARGDCCHVETCSCGTFHVTLGALTLRLDAQAMADVKDTLARALAMNDRTSGDAGPPPPHDPCERELVHAIDEWEVRIFDESRFQYFVERGLWHLQLWHPRSNVSVLTPSRLTANAYEVFPIAGWKQRAHDPKTVRALVDREHAIAFLDDASLGVIEQAFVRSPIDLATKKRQAS
jgi:hypothetical protein